MRKVTASAFTLLELMVAIALSLMVVLMLVTTFRAVINTMRSTERIALHNSLLRTGMILALEEADFWVLHDDPNDPARQLNRQKDDPAIKSAYETASIRGLTFVPFAELNSLVDGANGGVILGDKTGAPRQDSDNSVNNRYLLTQNINANGTASGSDAQDYPPLLAAPGAVTYPSPNAAVAPSNPLPLPTLVPDEEFLRNWDSTDPWSATDPKTWYYGSFAETLSGYGGNSLGGPPYKRSSLPDGRYAIFDNAKTRPQLGDPNQIASSNGPTGTFGPIESRHSWRANQLFFLRNALGYYGLAAYMPANTIYATYFSSINNGSGWEDVDEAMHIGWSRFPQMPKSSQSGVEYVDSPSDILSTMRFYTVSCFARSPYGFNSSSNTADKSTAALSVEKMAGDGTNDYSSDWNRGVAIGTGLKSDYHAAGWINNSQLIQRLLPTKSTKWPDLNLVSMRYLTNGHFVNTSIVRWTDNATAKVTEVAFNSFGTTLRGARQQRRYDPALFSVPLNIRTQGWSRWWATDEHLNRIVTNGEWYDRIVNSDGTFTIKLGHYQVTPPFPKPINVPLWNDRTLDQP